MNRRNYNLLIRVFVVLVALQLGAGAGCRCIKNKLGIGETITQTEKGTYEWAIRRLLAAALMEDREESWTAARKIFHSSELTNAARIKSYESMNWPALRRKVQFLVGDAKSKNPSYTIMKDEKVSSTERRIFIENVNSSPTPVRVRKDPGANGEWRIYTIP